MSEEKTKRNYSKYNKRYYWLKFKQDFFDEDTIRWLEEQEGGKDYVYFYLKLCSKAISTDGILIRQVGNILIPYDEKALSNLTHTPIDTIRVAMKILIEVGLVKILENGAIFLEQIVPLIGTESNKAELMRRKRAREKLTATKERKGLTSGNNVTTLLPNCYSDIDIDKDIDKESDITLDTLYLLINHIIDKPMENEKTIKELKRLNYYISDINFLKNEVIPQESKEYFAVVIYAINEIAKGKYSTSMNKLNEKKLQEIFLKSKSNINLQDENGSYTRFLNYFIKSLINEIRK